MFGKETKFLIVDDMLTMRKLVQKTLRDAGYDNFVEARDGQAAWEILNQANNGIGVVISDWNMPNCSGLDLLRRVRKDSRLKDLPFLLVTAESESKQVVEAIQAGVDSYVTKPFTSATVVEKLGEVYKKRGAAAA